MSETVLVINAGSSSIKFQLFEVGDRDELKRRFKGQIEGIGARPHLVAKDVAGRPLVDETWPKTEVSNIPAALEKVIALLRNEIGGRLPTAVGHRVVHGGPDYSEPSASMCALLEGKSVESTMGFTALDGLPMGTRPGQLDAGVVLYLMSEKGMSAKAIERFLYNDCGLKGLSGISNDVRELLASSDPSAKLALDYFTYRIALFTGMLASALGGIDGFVFTAAIGENAPAIREAVARRLSWLGLDFGGAPQR
jgi:acetate kinase